MTRTSDQLSVTTLRMLALDAVERANSGHPGLPLGMAPAAYALFSRILRFDPESPNWPNRDRFVLSAGHGSALLYGLLHLFGYDTSTEDLKGFRQLNSRTPGHPEYGILDGVETTTGPLGQGFGTAVGMALGERYLGALTKLDDGTTLIDHHTFVFASDGDLMEGISHEAGALAGHQMLGKLIVIWDNNGISIDGATSLATSEDILARFRAYGWSTQEIKDPENLDEIEAVLRLGIADRDRPTLISLPTVIGYGAPHKQGTNKAHGAALGPEEAELTRKFYGWSHGGEFYVPEEVERACRAQVAKHRGEREAWEARAGKFFQLMSPDLEGVTLPLFEKEDAMATRIASRKVLEELVAHSRLIVGGSADLSESTGMPEINAQTPTNPEGQLIHFGVREMAAAAAANGLALSGLHPFVATFLVFSDYMKPALRLSALMRLPVTYLFTHDSIALGEDGPTHQPIEHLDALAAIPHLTVLRPADPFETVQCWKAALRQGPTALVLTRQSVPCNPTHNRSDDWLSRCGARTVNDDFAGAPDVVLIASGSEVSLCLEASRILATEHDIAARVVSVPCRTRFLACSMEDRDQLAPTGVPRVVVEASSAIGWHEVLDPGDRLINLTNFGASGKGVDVQKHFGFDPYSIAEVAAEAATDGERLGAPHHVTSELLRATESTAIAVQGFLGLGDPERILTIASEVMEEELDKIPMDCTVVIDSGIKAMGQGVRHGTGRIKLDLVVHPLESASLASFGQEGAISAVTATPGHGPHPRRGAHFEALTVHADGAGVIDIGVPLLDNVRRVADRLGRGMSETGVLISDSDRHRDTILTLRHHGVPVICLAGGPVLANLRVLTGDVRAVLAWTIGDSSDATTSAAATLALAGDLHARHAPQTSQEEEFLSEVDPAWAERTFRASELAHPDSVVVATSVTGANPLSNPTPCGDGWILESLWIEPERWGVVRRNVP